MSERGGIISGFLVRMVFLFAFAGILLYEAGAVLVARVSVDGLSIDAAREAALTYERTADVKRARSECVRLARRSGAECIQLEIRDGFAYATIRKEPPTLFAHRVGALERWTIANSTHRAPIP